MMFVVYVIQNQAGQLYKGFTTDLPRRLHEHNSSVQGQWTSKRWPWRLVYNKEYRSKKETIDQERFLKSGKGRKYMQSIISGL